MTFEVIPAVDLRGGRVVRLVQGDYARELVFADDPVAVAEQWVAAGARRLHLVDLDGAAAGYPANVTAVRAIRQAVDIPLQLGGGLRTLSLLDQVFAAGIDRAIVGTAAIEDPAFLQEAAARFGPRLALSIDARDGVVAVRGWRETSGRTVEDLARAARDAGIGWLIVTDIVHDGTGGGTNLATLTAAARASGLPVIAAGGIATLEHLRAVRDAGAAGAIVGRALYDGTLDLRAALALQC
ncbi:MAG: 1-(5-phosphoribosyl)-5-[(5-phosphoribosylamino)methylideneamino]imidazole-4-carboxamide isomerase [Chloroflexota bacterium]|nr:1-(5-phosphoribosyl)-5-[(5-phosphoribosylamino)methylideneamino]imidazole-4-carboxamide isomerase [Dehalococcoidia bacterium]MDW8255108.1 1-(5-phosphoribosyl)-5-[(5-phosphoribosylamino)methylideneamino]imidazole-4-carboxamide isomerase [Chloroflexota bacterium]